MEHVPVWIQGVVAVALFLGAMLGAIIVVSKRGARLLAGESANDDSQSRFLSDLMALRAHIDHALAGIYEKLNELTVDVAVMRERQTNNQDLLRELQRQLQRFDRRKSPRAET